MNALLDRYATPLTIGLFAVSTVSGAALFFHVGQAAFHGMHEWLSMVLLLPVVLHVWKNWLPIVGYVKRRTLLAPIAASLVAAIAFAWPAMIGGGNGRGGSPPTRAMALLTDARLADLAPVMKTSPDALRKKLEAKGYQVASLDDTLAGVAAGARRAPNEVLIDVMSAR